MEQREFPQIIQEWMEIVRTSIRGDADRLDEYCEKLKIYAENNGEVYLKGFCFYYQGISRYLNAELDVAMDLLTEALKYLTMAEDWLMASYCYNSMGNIAAFQGDISLAIDCYLKGLSISHVHGVRNSEYNIRSNIANIQMMLGDHASALEMLINCERMVAEGLEIPRDQQAVVFANICVCYTHLGETEKAEKYLDLLREGMGDTPSSMDEIMFCVLGTQLYNRTGNIAARDQTIEKLNSLELKSMEVYDALTELRNHAQLLLDIGKIDEFSALIDRVNKLADSPTVKRHSLELQMRLCKIQGDDENYAKLAAVYYDISKQREQESNRIVSHNILMRIRLDDEENRRKEAERTNVVLRERSEHDALTGLNNRYKLNELSEEAFQRAYLSQKPLAVEILDIDCYKLYNDNYGHQAGDDCLVRIAETIRSMEEFPRVHTGRYGGDEFVLVYEEYSKEEVEKMAAILRERIHKLNFEHKYSTVSDHITITQGLFHAVPVMGNKLWDFMYSADMALYVVKRRGKDSFYVATDFDGVREEYLATKK